MTHSISCICGRLKGVLGLSGRFNRCVCYCADCQAFACFLKRDSKILDRSGGTEIIQVSPARISFTQGADHLASIRLTEKGLLRWYTSCCNTPIGNTHPNFKVSIVGLIHNCLNQEEGALDEAFGPVRVHVYTRYAKGEHKPRSRGVVTGISRLLSMLVRARLDGSYKHTPFFVPESGTPVVTPRVLSKQELRDIKE